MKRWIGRWFMVVAVLHTALAFVMFRAELTELLQLGVYDSVAGAPSRGKAVWFVLFGVLLFLFGSVVDAMEHAKLKVPLGAAVGVLILAGLGVMLMPRSGFWLVLPPAFAVLLGRLRAPTSAEPPAGVKAAG